MACAVGPDSKADRIGFYSQKSMDYRAFLFYAAYSLTDMRGFSIVGADRLDYVLVDERRMSKEMRPTYEKTYRPEDQIRKRNYEKSPNIQDLVAYQLEFV